MPELYGCREGNTYLKRAHEPGFTCEDLIEVSSERNRIKDARTRHLCGRDVFRDYPSSKGIQNNCTPPVERHNIATTEKSIDIRSWLPSFKCPAFLASVASFELEGSGVMQCGCYACSTPHSKITPCFESSLHRTSGGHMVGPLKAERLVDECLVLGLPYTTPNNTDDRYGAGKRQAPPHPRYRTSLYNFQFAST